MRVISLPGNQRKLITASVKQDRMAQKQLFDFYAPEMLKVCRRFIKDLQFAEDAMIKGFTKAFLNLQTFDTDREFDLWLKRIMINESISFLRSKNAGFHDSIENRKMTEYQGNIEVDDNVQWAIDRLPIGYKTVFLLYVVEGYKHHEIAEKLKISEGTSKSQLSKARKLLKTFLQKLNIYQNEPI
jgi:RNA polymerase sigma-70 factor (ECF subfamily)